MPPYPGDAERIPDTVADFESAEDSSDRRLVDVEFQTEPDADMHERAGEYAFRLRREVRHNGGQSGKYKVHSVVINLTGPPQPAELDMTEGDLDGAGIHQRMLVRTLRDEDAGRLAADVASGRFDRCVLAWLPLLHGGDREDIITEWKRLIREVTDERCRRGYVATAFVFAALAKRRKIWKSHLEEFTMQTSEVFDEIRLETRINTHRDDIRRLLRARFHTTIPADLDEALEATTELSTLESLMDAVVQVDSLEDFRARISAPGS